MFNLISRFHILLLSVLVAITGVALFRVDADFVIAAHWGPHSTPDIVWPRDLALLGPVLIALVILLAFGVLGLLLTKKRLMHSQHIFDPTLTLVLGVLNAIQMGFLLRGIGSDIDLIKLTGYAIGVLLVVIGVITFEAERHSYAGLRLPWPIHGDRAWRAIHALTGSAFAIMGAGLGLCVWMNLDLVVILPLLAAALLVPVFIGGVATLCIGRPPTKSTH